MFRERLRYLLLILDHTKGPKSSESAPVDAERSTPTYAGPRRILRERNIGDFQRSFTFPVGVDADKMEASLANGLLTLVVPKIASRSERKCIKVL
jgi:HSP20 family molecular chaperone IbpA